LYSLEKTVHCTACRHAAELHRDSGCIAFTRGDDIHQPRPCDCFRDALQATIVRVKPVRHLRAV